MSLAKFLLLVLVAAPILYFAFCEARKAYWDNQVRKMCEKDGQVNILNTLEVTPEQYASLPKLAGQYIGIPPKSLVSDNDILFAEDSEVHIKTGDPEVVRRLRVVRQVKTGATLGLITSYSRIGGDAPIGHPTHFSCPAYEDIYKRQNDFVKIKEVMK